MRPRSPFVARFVGQMNFLDAVAGERAGWARLGAVEMRHGAAERLVAGTRLTLAIRPEEITVGAAVGADEPAGHPHPGDPVPRLLHPPEPGPAGRRPGARVRRGGHRVRGPGRGRGLRAGARAAPRGPACLPGRGLARAWPAPRRRPAALRDPRPHHPAPAGRRGPDPLRAGRGLRDRPLPLRALPAAAVIWRSLLDQRAAPSWGRRTTGATSVPPPSPRPSRTASRSRWSPWSSRWPWPSATPTALTRTLMPCRGLFRIVAMLPLFAPVPGPGARLHLRLRQQRDLHPRHRLQRGHLRRQGYRGGRGVLLLPPRAAHPGGRALRHRRAPLRRGADARRLPAQDLPDRDPARREVRAGERLLRGLHPRHHRLRRAQGHRRASSR